MTEEEMEKMTVADWEKLFESNETQPGTIYLDKDLEEDEAEVGTVNLFKD